MIYRKLEFALPNACAIAIILAAAGVLSTISACPSTASQVACPQPPPPVRDFSVTGYYRDAAKSQVDAAALARRRQATLQLRRFLDHVAKSSDRAINGPTRLRQGHAACAIHWLRVWAEGRSYLGRMATKQAQAQRRWDLAGLALAYLKVRRFAGQDERRSIEPWLQDIADRDRALFEDRGKIRNNHWYWLGLGHAAVGLATASQRHWAEARRVMQDAASDIDPQGVLPREMQRGRRALHYHNFAVQPLVVLAELAAARGENWYAFGNGALHRLVATTVTGLNDPSLFDRLAGVTQERPVRPRAVWLQFYDQHFPDGLPVRQPRPRDYDRRLGGSFRALAKVLAKIGSGAR